MSKKTNAKILIETTPVITDLYLSDANKINLTDKGIEDMNADSRVAFGIALNTYKLIRSMNYLSQGTGIKFNEAFLLGFSNVDGNIAGAELKFSFREKDYSIVACGSNERHLIETLAEEINEPDFAILFFSDNSTEEYEALKEAVDQLYINFFKVQLGICRTKSFIKAEK